MNLITRKTSIWKNNSIDEMISFLDKRDYSRHFSEGKFNNWIKLIVVYDIDTLYPDTQYMAKLFDQNWKLINLISHEKKERFRKLVMRMIYNEESLRKLDQKYDLEEETRFDNFSDEEIEDLFNWEEEITQEKLLSFEREIENITNKYLEKIVVWYDDWFPDIVKWIRELTPVINSLSKISVVKIREISSELTPNDLRYDQNSACTEAYTERSYYYKKGDYFENERKYIITFWVTLVWTRGSQGYGEKNVIITF